MLLAKAWYFLSTAGSAFVLPYFNVYFDALGFSKEQIGTLSALRPWLSAPCAVALCSLADKLSCHTSLLVLTFTASLFLRCLLLLAPARFIAVAALVLLSDCIGAPVGAIVDATVVGACKSDGDYGKHRMWASAAWGGLSVVAGVLVAKQGLEAGFIVYLATSLPCIYIAIRIRKAAAAEKAGTTTSPAPELPGTASASKQQQQPAAKAAGAELDEAEDLTARLLPSTPDSSSCGWGSGCCGSDGGSPNPHAATHGASPFSRFCNKTFMDDGTYPAASAELTGAAAGSDAPQGGKEPEFAAAACTVGEEADSIKAWYQEQQQQRLGNSPPQQQQQSAIRIPGILPYRDGPEFVAGPAEVVLLDSPSLQPLAIAGASEAPALVPAAAEVPSLKASDGGIVVVSTKQSAKLELKGSQGDSGQLQASYSLIDWHASAHPAGHCSTVTESAASAAAAAQPHDESSPLLGLGSKQPLSASQAEAAAGSGEAVTIRSLLASPAVLVFMWRALIIGLGLGCIGNFLFLHVEELGGTGVLFGLMLFFNCITEVPAFMFQSTILAKLPVPFVFNASMLLLAVRLAGYGLLPLLHTPWAVLGLELLHGVTFATSWGAGIVHCKRLAPPHLNASMQGLFSSLYGGVGSGLGALLGGFLMQELGGQVLFFVCSAVVLCGWLVGYAVELLLLRASKGSASNKNTSNSRQNDSNIATAAA